MTSSDLLAARRPSVEGLEALRVAHMLGGSLASSVHGVPRTSIDGDLVADLELQHVTPLMERLGGAYSVDAGRMRAAIEARRSFNLIHLQTMFKIDVFVAKRRPFDQQALKRARRRTGSAIRRRLGPFTSLPPKTSFSRSWNGSAWAARYRSGNGLMCWAC